MTRNRHLFLLPALMLLAMAGCKDKQPAAAPPAKAEPEQTKQASMPKQPPRAVDEYGSLSISTELTSRTIKTPLYREETPKTQVFAATTASAPSYRSPATKSEGNAVNCQELETKIHGLEFAVMQKENSRNDIAAQYEKQIRTSRHRSSADALLIASNTDLQKWADSIATDKQELARLRASRQRCN
jgi:predicted small lipoprotein YifL